ncbi:MAG: DUF4956 domain-containing protein [bacterium]|nr:DUF4956 domain-containing protein [bacterium]
MIIAQTIFENVDDLTATFSVGDVAISLALSALLTMVVAYVYRATHHGVSYSQSYVQTLVLLGILVSLIMLVVGSNIARAFTLVGALSIVRFRNAVKETRDVGFIFFAMAIGMATGTRFYLLAAIATVVISLMVLMMDRFNMFSLDVTSQVVKVQLPPDTDPAVLEPAFLAHTTKVELISAESMRGGALTELLYTVRLKRGSAPTALLNELQARTSGQKVTLLTGYDRTDL